MAGYYVNGTEDGSNAEIYAGNYARLAKVKRAYDPDNIFRLNNNIEPAAE
jgi:FAD/FMN-containing dehydrogenase